MQWEIGQLITQVRQARGMSQAEMAKRLGTSQSAVNRMEHGKQNLSLKTLGRIGQVLDYKFISFNKPGKPRVKIVENSKSQRFIIDVDKLGPTI